MNAHVAFLEPDHGSVKVAVHIDRYVHLYELDELFLYNFDADVNCIEFAFGTRMENVEEKKFITYTTDAAIHRPPFRVEISHQVDTVHLEDYAFTISYEEI
jgi:hypothetical protein